MSLEEQGEVSKERNGYKRKKSKQNQTSLEGEELEAIENEAEEKEVETPNTSIENELKGARGRPKQN